VIEHGTPDGYHQGCKTRAVCPAVIPCVQVFIRYRSDLQFRRAIDAGTPLEQIVADDEAAAAAEVLAEREALRAEREAARAPRKVEKHDTRPRVMWTSENDVELAECIAAGMSVSQAARVMRKGTSTLRDRAAQAGLSFRDGRAGRTVRRSAGERTPGGVTGAEQVPAPDLRDARQVVRRVRKLGDPDLIEKAEARVRDAERARVPRPPRVKREKPPVEHGTLTMFRRGCRGDDCPADPSCSVVAGEFYAARNRSMVRKVKPHGTPASYARGCRRDEDCPNYGTSSSTCRAAQRAYHQEWVARRRAAGIPLEKHGTPYGYQLGCRAGDPCPASPSCAEASRAVEKARDRAAGIRAAEPMTDAGPVRDHVRSLLDSGMTLERIALAASVHRSQLGNLIYGRSGARGRRGGAQLRVTVGRAERIMAVRP
jgi:hypothetical protein